MKNLLPILVFIIVAPISFKAAQRIFDAETEWEYDNIRAKIAEYEKQKQAVENFWKTNTNPSLNMYMTQFNVLWKPAKGQKELGYKNDGTVVWRNLPEAPK